LATNEGRRAWLGPDLRQESAGC